MTGAWRPIYHLGSERLGCVPHIAARSGRYEALMHQTSTQALEQHPRSTVCVSEVCVALHDHDASDGWSRRGELPARRTEPMGRAVPHASIHAMLPALVAACGVSGSVLAQSNLAAWGANNHGQLDVPSDLGLARAMDAGVAHALAARLDGTVVAWGRDVAGCTVPPAGLSDVVAVAAGEWHSVAVRATGAVVCWGSNSHGQIAVPDDLPPIKAVYADGYFTLAHARAGTVHAWGSNQWGQLNIPTSVPTALEVSCGGNYVAALRADRSVVCWGYCGHGQCAVPADLGPVSAIAAGNLHMVALKQDGTVRCWGWNPYGQSVPPEGLAGVTAVAAGLHHSLALLGSGEVVCWGLGTPCAPLKNSGSVVRLAAGWDFSLALLASDTDQDGVDDSLDNCPFRWNPDQFDSNGDGIGNACETCAADLNGDGLVNSSDLPLFLNAWGQTGVSTADLDGDGIVGSADLTMLLAAWGVACPPAIASIDPVGGPIAGGTTITITGTNLASVVSLTIGGVEATSVARSGDLMLTAVTPAGTMGPRDVVVTTAAGSATRAGGFTYSASLSWATVVEALPNPAVVFDAELRERIIATGYPWRVRDNGTQIEMVLIPPGTFNMGCSASSQSACDADESPVHAVTLTNAFYLGCYEVTQTQWQARMGTNPSQFQGFPDSPSRPVERVSYSMILGFRASTGLRLPTEAEWEYACRAGTLTAFHGFTGYIGGTNDDSLVGNIAWYSGNNGAPGNPSYGTKAVGQKLANGFGLHDMSGNVFEWVQDLYSASYYASSPSTNPTGPSSGGGVVVRGGSWSTGAPRSSSRTAWPPDGITQNWLGFRVARNPL
jgi:formylglycine-generating enzyme required for sulfatase activity